MKRNIAFCFCCLLAAGLASEAWAALPVSVYRCASQFSTTVKVDFTIHAGTADIAQVTLSFSVKGRISDVRYSDIFFVLPGGTSGTMIAADMITSLPGNYDGWTLQFTKLSPALGLYDYQLVITPEGSNYQWRAGSSLTQWSVTVYGMDPSRAFQFNAEIHGTSGEALLTGVTPNRQLSVIVQDGPVAPIAVNDTKYVTFKDDGHGPGATLHMSWRLNPVPGFAGTVGWISTSADPIGTGILQISPNSQPAAGTVYKLYVTATDRVANATSGFMLSVDSIDVPFTVGSSQAPSAPQAPSGLRIRQ